MNNISLTSKHDLSLFIKNKKFKKIFVLSGKKSYKLSGAKNILNRILDGEAVGTLFLPQKRISSRHRWIAYSRPPKGQVFVDEGAHHALLNHGGSLLPCGVQQITGKFEFGDTISCRDQNGREFARGLVNYNTQEAQQIIGKNTHEIEQILGYHYYDEIIHRDNLVLIS